MVKILSSALCTHVIWPCYRVLGIVTLSTIIIISGSSNNKTKDGETDLDLLEDVVEPMFAHQLRCEVFSTEPTKLQPQSLQTFYHLSEQLQPQ